MACRQNKDADIRSISLLQQVAACDTEVEMHGAVTSLLNFYSKNYGGPVHAEMRRPATSTRG